MQIAKKQATENPSAVFASFCAHADVADGFFSGGKDLQKMPVPGMQMYFLLYCQLCIRRIRRKAPVCSLIRGAEWEKKMVPSQGA